MVGHGYDARAHQLDCPPDLTSMSSPSIADPGTRVGQRLTQVRARRVVYTDEAGIRIVGNMRRCCFNCRETETMTWRRSSLNPGKLVCLRKG